MNIVSSHTKSHSKKGFSVVELLVVIVVIGILAALVIVGYRTILTQAKSASIKSDLKAAVSSLSLENSKKGRYPVSIVGMNLQAGDTVFYQYSYNSVDKNYCITASDGTLAFHSYDKGTIADGPCPEHSTTGPMVTTFAGSGTAGSTNNTGTAASFNGPYDIDFDTAGNMYVAECYNNRIRKITPAGLVSTLAGSGATGSANNTNGALATFSCPTGIAVNAAGEVFVADSYNHRIRKITPAGAVTTFAGNTQGFANATGTAALFNSPSDVDVDQAGVLYVSDTGNNRIRKITTGAAVSTLTGLATPGYVDGDSTVARFSNNIVGLAVDTAGTVYVADGFNARIRKVTPAGSVSTLAGSGTQGYADGVTVSAQFGVPFGIAVDSSGTLYVSDGNNDRIRIVSPTGVVTTLSGSSFGYLDGRASDALFRQPRGVALDASGNLFVADIDNYRIRKISLP